MSISQIANIYIRKCLDDSSNAYNKTLDQLSSGNKYTSLGDNPAIVTAGKNIEIDINFNSRIQSNIDLGSDMLTTANEYQENLIENIQRIKDLTIQAGNETCTDSDRNEILNEIKTRLSYINELSSTANFNGIKLLDGTATDINIKTGLSSSDNINIDSVLIDTSTAALGINITATSGADWDTSSIEEYLTKLDSASALLTSNCAKIGAINNRLDSISDNITETITTLTNYKSQILDTDTAEASADLIKYQILQQAAVNIFLQTNDISKMKASLFTDSY